MRELEEEKKLGEEVAAPGSSEFVSFSFLYFICILILYGIQSGPNDLVFSSAALLRRAGKTCRADLNV